MIDANGDVHPLLLQRFQSRLCRWDRVCDGKASQIFRLLPDVDVMGDNAGQAHPQAVFHGDHGGFFHPTQPLHIGAEAIGISGSQETIQIFLPVVEIMVAQGEKIIAAAVEHLGGDAGIFQAVFVEKIGKGTALQCIAAVNDQGIPVVLEAAHAVGSTGIGPLPGGIVQGGEIAVHIAGKINGQFFHNVSFRTGISALG